MASLSSSSTRVEPSSSFSAHTSSMPSRQTMTKAEFTRPRTLRKPRDIVMPFPLSTPEPLNIEKKRAPTIPPKTRVPLQTTLQRHRSSIKRPRPPSSPLANNVVNADSLRVRSRKHPPSSFPAAFLSGTRSDSDIYSHRLTTRSYIHERRRSSSSPTLPLHKEVPRPIQQTASVNLELIEAEWEFVSMSDLEVDSDTEDTKSVVSSNTVEGAGCGPKLEHIVDGIRAIKTRYEPSQPTPNLLLLRRNFTPMYLPRSF